MRTHTHTHHTSKQLKCGLTKAVIYRFHFKVKTLWQYFGFQTMTGSDTINNREGEEMGSELLCDVSSAHPKCLVTFSRKTRTGLLALGFYLTDTPPTFLRLHLLPSGSVCSILNSHFSLCSPIAQSRIKQRRKSTVIAQLRACADLIFPA